MSSRQGSVRIALFIGGFVLLVTSVAGSGAAVAQRNVKVAVTTGVLSQHQLTSPPRVVLSDSQGTVATFTAGARTVTVRGASRIFSESTTAATVTTRTWVRFLDTPFDGTVDNAELAWLTSARADTGPDVLARAMQYVTGAPDRFSASGQRIAGDASYGPLLADGTRGEGADFNDFLGVSWVYPSGPDAPEPDQSGSLDCSGFVRMVLGYRSGLPLVLDPDGQRLPRRSFQMLASGPGILVVPDLGVVPAVDRVLPGDLLFFDASTNDGVQVDHVAIYLGVDSTGAPRFLSSRKTVDGPTMGDVGGRSTLSGTGLYASSFRAVRRV
jgi:cell wall-associated NlpC family hydrolase